MNLSPVRSRSWIMAVLVIVPLFILTGEPKKSSNKILIIQDELPQLVVLTQFLTDQGNLDVQIVDQTHQLPELSKYRAVLIYIHKKLEVSVEKAIIDYTKKGGRLVVLHHSISSGKAKNEFYFDFLGIHLDNPEKAKEPVDPGEGYGWVDPGTFSLVNLHSSHYISNHNVTWGERIPYTPSDSPSSVGLYPSISLDSSEVYMNHKFIDGREKTVLCGLKFYDPRNGKLFMQDRALWIKKQGKGEVIYFMPGHTRNDYANIQISQIVLNSIEWKP